MPICWENGLKKVFFFKYTLKHANWKLRIRSDYIQFWMTFILKSNIKNTRKIKKLAYWGKKLQFSEQKGLSVAKLTIY